MSTHLPKGLNRISADPVFRETQLFREFETSHLGMLDVGARGGFHDIAEPLAELISVVGFEPDEEECARLLAVPEVTDQWGRYSLFPYALGEGEGDATLHLMSTPTNHSLLPANTDFVSRYAMKTLEQVGTVSMRTVSLDSLSFDQENKLAPAAAEFIKLDTQGSELEIFKGARRVMARETVAIFTEVSFATIYRDQPLFSDVEAFLREQGFTFYGFPSLHNRSRKALDKHQEGGCERTIYADAVFFKDPFEGGAQLSNRQGASLLLCAMMLGYFDFALELSEKFFASDLSKLGTVIHGLARYDKDALLSDIRSLCQGVEANPDEVSKRLGGFIDDYRGLCDYHDLNVRSALPKTY